MGSSDGTATATAERGSLQLDSSLVIGLLVLIAAVTLFAFGTSIACLFAKEASQVNRVAFYTTPPAVTTSATNAGEVTFGTEGMTGPFTIMRGRPGNPGYNPSEVETWDVLKADATSPATGLDIKDGDRVAIVADAERCGFRLVGAQWPSVAPPPAAGAWYAATTQTYPDAAGTGGGTDYVSVHDGEGKQIWKDQAIVDDSEAYLYGVSVSDDTLYTYAVPDFGDKGIYTIADWKNPDNHGELTLFLGSLVVATDGTAYELSYDDFRASKDDSELLALGYPQAGGDAVLLAIDASTLSVQALALPGVPYGSAVYGLDNRAYAMNEDGELYRLGEPGLPATRIGSGPVVGGGLDYQVLSVDSDGNAMLGSYGQPATFRVAPDGTASAMPDVANECIYTNNAFTPDGDPVLMDGVGYYDVNHLRLASAASGTDIRYPLVEGFAGTAVYGLSSVMGNARVVDPPPADAAPVTVSDAHPVYRTTATISLVARDGDHTGVKTTYYSLDGGATQEGLSVSTSVVGTHTLDFWSDDTAVELPMVEDRNTVEFEIVAGTPPAHMPDTASDAVPLYEIVDAPGSPTEAAITLTAYDPDPATPVSNTYWKLDGGATQVGTDVRTDAVGVHTLEFWSDDTAVPANVETPHKTARFEVVKEGGPRDPRDTGAWNYSILVNGEAVYSQDFIPEDPDSVELNPIVPDAARPTYGKDVGGGDYLQPFVRMRTDRTLDTVKTGRSNVGRFSANAIRDGVPTAADGFIRPFGTVSDPDRTLLANGVSVTPGWRTHTPDYAPFISLIEHRNGHIAASGPNAVLANNLCLSVGVASENKEPEGAKVNRRYVLGGSVFLPQAGEADPSRRILVQAPMVFDSGGLPIPDKLSGRSMADLSYQVAGISWDEGAGSVPDFSLGFFNNDTSFPSPLRQRGKLVASDGTVVSSMPSIMKGNVIEVRITGGTVRPTTRSHDEYPPAEDYKVTTTSGPGGSVTPLGVTMVEPGGGLQVDFTPIPGASVADVVVNGTSIGSVGSYTISDISSDYTIDVTFSVPESWTYSVTVNGSVVHSQDVTVRGGAVLDTIGWGHMTLGGTGVAGSAYPGQSAGLNYSSQDIVLSTDPDLQPGTYSSGTSSYIGFRWMSPSWAWSAPLGGNASSPYSSASIGSENISFSQPATNAVLITMSRLFVYLQPKPDQKTLSFDLTGYGVGGNFSDYYAFLSVPGATSDYMRVTGQWEIKADQSSATIGPYNSGSPWRTYPAGTPLHVTVKMERN